MTRCDYVGCVRASLRQIVAGRTRDPAWCEVDEATRLFGDGGILNSFDLVNLVLELEEVLRVRTGRRPSLLDERTMASGENPFRDIRSLVDLLMSRAAECV